MNDIKALRLTNGGFTILDNTDFEKFRHKRWQGHPNGYVIRCVKRDKKPYTVRLHHAPKIGKPRVYLGSFATPFEAAVAYNHAAKSRWGEFARLNNLCQT